LAIDLLQCGQRTLRFADGARPSHSPRVDMVLSRKHGGVSDGWLKIMRRPRSGIVWRLFTGLFVAFAFGSAAAQMHCQITTPDNS